MYRITLMFKLVVLILFYSTAFSAQVTQVVKGQVIDRQTKVEIVGANVMIKGTLTGASTDIDGYFRILNVPVGRHTIEVMYVGYKPTTLPEILVGSGKEIVLNIELDEEIIESETIVVTPSIEKSKPLNATASVSARSFSVEETQRYAGGFDDPARLASSFAGVTYGNAQDNAVIIRGNAPKGLLWRLEGIEIPNPNHFPDGNVFGGGLFTVFSNQLLANSDFFTGAFPAEYGNALSGVFDMRLRNGNNEVREWTFQAGLMGFDFAAEGPFSSGSRASYLVNYRYSTIGLLTDFGIVDTEQKPGYQDLSFKINFPTKNSGTFSLWGLGSFDRNNEVEETDSTKWELEWDRVKYDATFSMGTIGLNHRYIFGKSTFINTTIATTAEEIIYDLDRLDDNVISRRNESINSFNGKTTIKSKVDQKFSSHLFTTTGFTWNYLSYDMNLKSTIDDVPETYQTFVDEAGNSQLFQAYTQWQIILNNKLRLNAGLHYEYFNLNDNSSIEPRFGINWELHPQHSLSFGYGKHSQLENIRYYLSRRETENGIIMPNKNLDFTRADHFVIGYDYQLTDNTRLKIEPYYQYLYDVPVSEDGTFSFINLKDERYYNETLQNKGTGTNIGLDLTLERFLSDNYYYLLTASIFDSKYKGGDGVERNSRYNRNFVLNALFGKEFIFSDKNILGLNVRFTYMGGERISPVLRDASLAAKRVLYDETNAFRNSLSASRYLDVTASYRLNQPQVAHIFTLQIKNLLGSPNDYGYAYNFKDNDLKEDEQVIVLPSISYKIEF